MTGKPKRRKKAKPAKCAARTFTITVEAQPMRVRYEPNAFGEMAHFEYQSPYEPPRRIPYSDTGYFSHHASMDRVKAAKSPADFARNELLALMRYGMKGYSRDIVELPLF